jgi:hypothetical protein
MLVDADSEKNLCQHWYLDYHELCRQVEGYDFKEEDIYDNYISSYQGINKRLQIVRFTFEDVQAMRVSTMAYGPNEVDVPANGLDIDRHLKFLSWSIHYDNVMTSDLWTLDLPVDIIYETSKGLEAYRKHLATRRAMRMRDDTPKVKPIPKRQKFTHANPEGLDESDTNDDDTFIGPIGISQHHVRASAPPSAPSTPVPTGDTIMGQATPGADFYFEAILNHLERIDKDCKRIAERLENLEDKVLTGDHAQGTHGHVEGDANLTLEAIGNISNSTNLYLSSIETYLRDVASAYKE